LKIVFISEDLTYNRANHNKITNIWWVKLKNIGISFSAILAITILSACKSTEVPDYSSPKSGAIASLKLPAISNRFATMFSSGGDGVTIRYSMQNTCIKQSALDKKFISQGGVISIPAETQLTISLTSTQDGFTCSGTKVFSPTADGEYEITFNVLYKKCSFSLYQNTTATTRIPLKYEQSIQSNLPNCS
jgi:hypothetical protein